MLLSLLPPHGLFHHTQNIVADGSYPFLLRMDSSAPVMTNERVRPPVAPVQRVTDFIAGSAGQDADLPSSSYRLGVRAGPLHEVLFPPAGHSRIYVLYFFAGALSSDYFAPACLATRHDTLPSLFFCFLPSTARSQGKKLLPNVSLQQPTPSRFSNGKRRPWFVGISFELKPRPPIVRPIV